MEELTKSDKGRIDWAGFKSGEKYKVITLIGQQKFPREHVMVFLGLSVTSTMPGRSTTSWSARPFAGTQELRDDDIRAIYAVDDQTTPCYMNRRHNSDTRLV